MHVGYVEGNFIFDFIRKEQKKLAITASFFVENYLYYFIS